MPRVRSVVRGHAVRARQLKNLFEILSLRRLDAVAEDRREAGRTRLDYASEAAIANLSRAKERDTDAPVLTHSLRVRPCSRRALAAARPPLSSARGGGRSPSTVRRRS